MRHARQRSGLRAPGSVTEALRLPPTRFLTSSWPWRSLAYLTTGGLMGLVTGAAIFGLLVFGVLFTIVVKEAPPETVAELQGVDTLICDALRHTPHPTHMNIEEALAFSAQVGPRQTWFTHHQCEIMHARDEPKLPHGVKLAYDGLKLSW